MLHLRQKKSTSLYFHFSWFIIGNGNSPAQKLQNSVLGCLKEIICSLDKAMFNVAFNLLQCSMCGCI